MTLGNQVHVSDMMFNPELARPAIISFVLGL